MNSKQCFRQQDITMGFRKAMSMASPQLAVSLSLASLRPPLRCPKSRKRLKLSISKLYVSRTNHTGLEPQRRAHILVYCSRGIVSHNKVMAVCVLHLMD